MVEERTAIPKSKSTAKRNPSTQRRKWRMGRELGAKANMLAIVSNMTIHTFVLSAWKGHRRSGESQR